VALSSAVSLPAMRPYPGSVTFVCARIDNGFHTNLVRRNRDTVYRQAEYCARRQILAYPSVDAKVNDAFRNTLKAVRISHIDCHGFAQNS